MPSSKDQAALLAAGAALPVPPDIERSMRALSGVKRSSSAKALARLFVEVGRRAGSDAREVIDAVMLGLVSEVDEGTRAEIAKRIAQIEPALVETVRAFARDVIAVADPILRHAKSLSDEDLIAVARTLTEAHRLAVGNRSAISAAVTDVLIERGEAQVLRTVAANKGASLSDAGIEGLMRRVKDGDEAIESALVTRTDLPATVRNAIVSEADRTARERLTAMGFGDESDDILAAAMASAVGGPPANPLDMSGAQKAVMAAMKARKLDENFIQECAKKKDAAGVICGTAALAKIDPRLAEAILRGTAVEPILLLCRSIPYSAPAVELVLSINDVMPFSKEDSLKALGRYRRTTPDVAKRVVRYMKLKMASGG